MGLNHRTRLALVSATAAGLILLALFTAIGLLARQSVLGDKRAELDAVMRSFTPPSDASFDLVEFHEAHPELSASVYEKDGRRVGEVGRTPPAHALGFKEEGRRLTLGRTFRGQDVSISLDLRDAKHGLWLLSMTLIVVWFPLTLLIGGITWAAAHSVFRPLERLSDQALAMSGTNLSERLVTPDLAEFGTFARNLNRMLDRIEETVRRGERFSADAAHELRTPLALIRTRLETALIQPRSPEQYEVTIRRSVDEIARLTAITEALLRSARGEFQEASAAALAPIAWEAVDRWNERFAQRDVMLEPSISAASAVILPEEARVVFDNLLDNALRYAPARSAVTVRLDEVGDAVHLSVRDAGPGVPAELGDKIFDRFVRADDSRNRASGGVGIGLAVCRQIVEGRGGAMVLDRSVKLGAAIGCRLPSSHSSAS